MREAVQFVFSGTIAIGSFQEFAEHRAAKLDIWLDICSSASECVKINVEGEPDLVDAFEMACSLGPQDCIILDVARKDLPGFDWKRIER